MGSYSDDCTHLHNAKDCKLFDMSCAMFHTRIFGRIPGYNNCPYYISKDEAIENAETKRSKQ